jgi:hypothetical protein
MWEKGLKKHLESETAALLDQYAKTKGKYQEIWNFYQQHMPTCIVECTELRKGYGQLPDREGPQGIYWIGRDPKVLFVGKEHFGWYGEASWPEHVDTICYSPLQFAFYTIESMGSYWAKIQDLMDGIFDDKEYEWRDKLQKVAFSNACKCLSENRSYLWNLHENCLKHRYLSREISTIGAKVNVLFTKTHPIMDKLFDTKLEVVSRSELFPARRHGSQIIIECAHPGRESEKWREQLKKVIKEHLKA